MNDNYVLQDVIDLIRQQCQDSEIKKKLESALEYRHVSKIEFRNILLGNMPYSTISKDQVILIYDLLANIGDVPPKSDFFEDIEIKNADAQSKLYGTKDLLRIITNKGIEVNPERKVDFIVSEYITKYSDKRTTKDIINKLSQMAQSEGDLGKDLSDFTQADFINLLSGYSANAFNAYKNIITKYIGWCYENGYTSEDRLIAIQEISSDQIENHAIYLEQYFVSVKQVLNLLKIVEENIEGSEKIPEYAWSNIICPAIVLSWIGFDIEEIVELKPSHVNVEQGEIYYPKTDKKVSQIDPEIMDIIENTKKNSVSSAAEYLLFSEAKASLEKPLKINLIAQRITQINKVATEINLSKKFGTKKIRLSGSYNRMAEYEKLHDCELNNSDRDIVSTLCKQEIEPTRISIILNDFKKWKQALSNEQV